MKKSEIIQIAIIILGICIIFRTLLSVFEQLSYSFKFISEQPTDYNLIFVLLAVIALLIIIGVLLIYKSEYLSKKVIKDDDIESTSTNLNKSEIIQISIVILCLYFIIIYSPGFISSISNIIFNFVNDFRVYQEMLPKNIWSIILYISIFIVLVNSKKFSAWLEQKIF